MSSWMKRRYYLFSLITERALIRLRTGRFCADTCCDLCHSASGSMFRGPVLRYDVGRTRMPITDGEPVSFVRCLILAPVQLF